MSAAAGAGHVVTIIAATAIAAGGAIGIQHEVAASAPSHHLRHHHATLRAAVPSSHLALVPRPDVVPRPVAAITPMVATASAAHHVRLTTTTASSGPATHGDELTAAPSAAGSRSAPARSPHPTSLHPPNDGFPVTAPADGYPTSSAGTTTGPTTTTGTVTGTTADPTTTTETGTGTTTDPDHDHDRNDAGPDDDDAHGSDRDGSGDDDRPDHHGHRPNLDDDADLRFGDDRAVPDHDRDRQGKSRNRDRDRSHGELGDDLGHHREEAADQDVACGPTRRRGLVGHRPLSW